MKQLHQMGIVQEYQAQFEDLCSLCEEWNEGALLSFIIGGLKYDIRCELLAQNPKSLEECYLHARIIEEKYKRMHGTCKGSWNSNFNFKFSQKTPINKGSKFRDSPKSKVDRIREKRWMNYAERGYALIAKAIGCPVTNARHSSVCL